MPIAQVAAVQIMQTTETNPELMLGAVFAAMGEPIAAASGYGVIQVRDANGRLTAVQVFFDDKIPQSERSAALSRIGQMGGVATIKPVGVNLHDNFDALAAGAKPSYYDLSMSNDGSTVIGGASVEAANSAPHSMKLSMQRTALNQGYSCQFFMHSNAMGTPLLIPGLPMSSFKWGFKWRAPATFLGATSASERALFSMVFVDGIGQTVQIQFRDASPATLNHDKLSLTIVSSVGGQATPIELPLDGNFHDVSMEAVGAAVTVKVDATSFVVDMGFPLMTPQLLMMQLDNFKLDTKAYYHDDLVLEYAAI
jgi:hypothetical protein